MICEERKFRVPELAGILRTELLESAPEEGAPLESTREIAARFGVSPLTADRAVKQLVDDGLLYRVKGSGTFFRGTPPKKKSRLVIAYAAQPSYALPIQQRGSELAVAHLRAAGAGVKFILHHELKKTEIGRAELENVDGLLLSGDLLDPDILRTLETFDRPTVLMRHDFITPERFHQVVLDFQRSFDDTVARIGRKQEIWLVYETHRNGEYRKEEFLAALKRGGFDLAKARLIPVDFLSGSDIANYRLALELSKEVAGKFIFCTSDVVSDLFLSAFQEKRIIPGVDFDWVGCDNLAVCDFGSKADSPLTTVDCHSDLVAVESVKLLLDRIESPSPYQTIVRIPTDLVLRKSAFQNKSQEA